MNRRTLLAQAWTAAAIGLAAPPTLAASPGARGSKVRPTDRAWPGEADWDDLKRRVRGNLVKPHTVWEACQSAPGTTQCLMSLKNVRNPFYLGDSPGGTQVSGWLDAWSAEPSAYAVAARDAADVAEAVNFARRHNLRLVVKGGGHSYLGGSNAADSLLIWTRAMNRIELHDAFAPEGQSGPGAPAVTLEAGCMWIDAYTAVTTRAGRYVQGGGCTSVGVAGFIQGGGFGSLSKGFGLGAQHLLEAEIVTADGVVRTVNAHKNPDLFWALKGGGGGTFGVVTMLTLRTHDLPQRFGGADAQIEATSPEAFRRLVAAFIDHYAAALFNEHWGEQAKFGPDLNLDISMMCQGLTTDQAKAAWEPFFGWARDRPADYQFTKAAHVSTWPAREQWDTNDANAMIKDERPQAPAGRAYWRGDQEQVSMFIHGYDSQWLPASLLQPGERARLVSALVEASAFRTVALHFNKGLAGAPPSVIAEARGCAMNPAVTEAFCLVIVADGGPPPFVKLPGFAADPAIARRNADAVAKAAARIKTVAPGGGSYISETDYFRKDWREAFWGANYARLRAIKAKYDPTGLFFVHHAVGSEDWSADGFRRT